MDKIKGIVYVIVGALLSVPFIYDIFILGKNYHSLTLWVWLMILMMGLGCASVIIGFIKITVKHPGRSGSSNDVDVSRIRYAAEQELLKK
jgi:hypothetical protein